MNKSSVSRTQRFTSFQILFCVWIRYTRTPNQTLHGNKDWRGSEVHPKTDLDRIDGEPMEFGWSFHTLQLSQEVRSLLLGLHETSENFTGRMIFMSMFDDISCGTRDNEKECESNVDLFLFARILGTGLVISWSWF